MGLLPGRPRYLQGCWGMVCEGEAYHDFSNARVTTMLPLLPPKVNVGCWTRELKAGFQTALVLSTGQVMLMTRTGTPIQPLVPRTRTSTHLQ